MELANGQILLYRTDCLKGIESVSEDVFLLTDPPYGTNYGLRDYKSRGRGALAECQDFPEIAGDDKPFDPTPFLRFRRSIIFGANYFADKLPQSTSWLVWDKLNGLESKRKFGFNDNADCELAWTNLGGPPRILRHRWMGAMKESEQRERRIHPTQKPIALMQKIIELFTSPDDIVFDPFAGSGSTLIAAYRAGRQSIGVELSKDYYQRIVSRINEECLISYPIPALIFPME